MNNLDLVELTEFWAQETGRLNDKLEESIRAAQDHAYELGLQRGRAERRADAVDGISGG